MRSRKRGPQGDARADAGLRIEDLRQHDAGVVGLCAGSVQGGQTGRPHGVSGRRRDEERERPLAVPTVFDNLIARGDMPPTIAVFINPGHEKSKPQEKGKHSNRGLEYDGLGDRYVRFLLEEIIPEVRKKYAISDDPEMPCDRRVEFRCDLCLHRRLGADRLLPQGLFQRRQLHESRGERLSVARPQDRAQADPVYMADTSGDVDNAFGSWPWANQQMASALKYAGYDVRFDWAEGYARNADFGGARSFLKR